MIPRVPVATIKPENLPQLRIWLRKGVFVMPEARVVVRVDASRMPVRRETKKFQGKSCVVKIAVDHTFCARCCACRRVAHACAESAYMRTHIYTRTHILLQMRATAYEDTFVAGWTLIFFISRMPVPRARAQSTPSALHPSSAGVSQSETGLAAPSASVFALLY